VVLPIVLDQEEEVAVANVDNPAEILAEYSYADYFQDFANALDRGNGGSSELTSLPSDDPRSLALNWIKNDDTTTDGSALVTESMPIALAMERYVAATLYYSLIGTGETNNHELSTSFGFLGSDSICSWRSQFFLGIWCNEDKQVEEISIYNVDGLNGTIPSEIALLQDLEKIHIAGLGGSSTMPTQMGNLEKLDTLTLCECLCISCMH